jgi:hypothetical protein
MESNYTIKTKCYQCNKEGRYGEHVRRLKIQVLSKQAVVGKGEAALFEASFIGNESLACAFDDFNLDIMLCHEVMGTRLDPEDHSVLVISKLEIDPSHRGSQLGIRMIENCITEARLHAGTDLLVLLHPCPLQWKTRQEQEAGERKLSRYYCKHLPLKRLKKTPYYYLQPQ